MPLHRIYRTGKITMAMVLGTIVEEARRRAFVGRGAELFSFNGALTGNSPRRILFVHGPGGIGKTELLHRFAQQASAAGRVVAQIDGRDVDCSPDGLRSALQLAAVEAGGEPGQAAQVLLLDGYERFGPIDDWFREELLTSLDADTVVVLAGREPPSTPWVADPGWRALVAVHHLGELTMDQSIDLLSRAGVAAELRSHLAVLGQGHPLTLALLAQAATAGSVPDNLADASDLVAALVGRIAGEAPTQAHALGRMVCALSWLTTEDLLREAVGEAAPEVWAWLERQPYIITGAGGLYPHDLVRDVLDADLRRRSRELYEHVYGLVHRHAIATIHRPADRELGIHQKLYLHRNSPLKTIFWAMREKGSVALATGGSDDRREVLDMIVRFEGAQSAATAARWFDAQPENLHVVRSAHGVSAYLYEVIHPTDPTLLVSDPVVRAVLDHAAQLSGSRPGEQISIARFHGGTIKHQRDPYGLLVDAVGSTVTWFTRPLAWSFVVTVDPDFWRPYFEFMAFTDEFAVPFGGQRYTVFGIDWRRLPVDAWEQLLGQRGLTGETGPPPAELLRPPPLDRAGFADAVREALRDLQRPDRLRASALMQTTLAAGAEGERVDRLRGTLLSAVAQVGREGRGDTLARVLDQTFVRAVGTQEAAAEVLDLPFSTYRRHLVRAVERVTDVLWAAEIGEIRLPVFSVGEQRSAPFGQ